MTLIRTRMYRYSLRSKQLAIYCKTLNIRQITTTRIAQRSYFVDINT